MSLLASIARPLWRLLEDHRIDADAFFRQHGLDPALVKQSRGRFPYENLCRAWCEASVVTGNPHIGLRVGQYLSPLDFNALGVTFLSSANLREALYRLKRYESILNTSLSFTIEESDDVLRLGSSVDHLPDYALVIIEDTRLSSLMTLARAGLNKDGDAIEVGFTYSQPAQLGDHFSAFRCELAFDQPEAYITFKQADVRIPFTDANRELAQSSDAFLDNMLKQFQEQDLVSRVKRSIIEALPSGAPSEADVARRVFVSSRTLQRRLAEEGTSFRTLLLEVRRELAERYISDKSIPLAEISYMLGFSDSSSFSRAFKRWTGDPPAAFRQKITD